MYVWFLYFYFAPVFGMCVYVYGLRIRFAFPIFLCLRLPCIERKQQPKKESFFVREYVSVICTYTFVVVRHVSGWLLTFDFYVASSDA